MWILLVSPDTKTLSYICHRQTLVGAPQRQKPIIVDPKSFLKYQNCLQSSYLEVPRQVSNTSHRKTSKNCNAMERLELKSQQ